MISLCKSQFKTLCFFSLICFLLYACDEIIEPDITNEVFSVVTPPTEFTANTLSINFYWELLDGAAFYRLQIARPDFAEPIQILVDSAYESNATNINLGPGSYEWRMRAENFNTFSNYVYGRLVVDSSASLDGAMPNLTFPSNNQYSNADEINFSWEPLFSATEYRFELIHNESSSDVLEVITNNTGLNADLVLEGTYLWRITALNLHSISNVGERNLFIDRTAPPPVISSTPADDFEAGDTLVTFTWQIPNDLGTVLSPLSFELEIAEQSNFASQIFITPIFTSVGITEIILPEGTYYWRIHSQDEAGNSGVYSVIKKITIEP